MLGAGFGKRINGSLESCAGGEDVVYDYIYVYAGSARRYVALNAPRIFSSLFRLSSDT